MPWTIIAGLTLAGWYPTIPVEPRQADTPRTEFSAARAMEHVDQIARAPHPIGSPEIERVRDYITVEVEALDLEVDLQTVPAHDFYGDGGSIDVVNVIAWIPGFANTKAVVIVGHYDTFPATPGANDNSAAVAAMLEAARALQAGPPLDNDIVFLFTDGEEPFNRFGSNGFAAVPGLLDSLGVVVNLEANGSGGASTLVETNGPQSWLVGGFGSAADSPAAYSFLTETTELIGEIGTDFDVFRRSGLPGLHFAYLRGSPIYHTMEDDIDSVGLGSLQHHGENILAIARHFGHLDLSTIPSSGRSVFFTAGPFFVLYSARWAAVLAVFVAGLYGLPFVGSRRRSACRWQDVVKSAAVMAGAALSGAVAGTFGWLVVTDLRPSLGVVESYGYFAVILAAAVLVARWVVERVGGRRTESSRYGIVLLWAILALATSAVLSGFSYLFVWPTIAAAAGLLWHPGSRAWAIFRFVVVATPTMLLMTPAVDYLFLFAQPRPGNLDSELTVVVVVPLLFGVLVAALLDRR
ncbi:MAG: M28 family peptidase, partial [Acidimicrobiia bacterium]|nr:M28 family peptidase [Acidimicrobiia bacterium]